MEKTNLQKNYKNELEENNSYYDVTGNMNIWRVHETYEGSGNPMLWEKILKDEKP